MTFVYLNIRLIKEKLRCYIHTKLRINFRCNISAITYVPLAQTACPRRLQFHRTDQFYFSIFLYRGHPVARRVDTKKKKNVSANQSAYRYQILISRSVCVRVSASALSQLWNYPFCGLNKFFIISRTGPSASLLISQWKSVQGIDSNRVTT